MRQKNLASYFIDSVFGSLYSQTQYYRRAATTIDVYLIW
jgi:hypothetical protein